MRISDWSSDVCSSDLVQVAERPLGVDDVDPHDVALRLHPRREALADHLVADHQVGEEHPPLPPLDAGADAPGKELRVALDVRHQVEQLLGRVRDLPFLGVGGHSRRASVRYSAAGRVRSEEHTSELQSLMRLSNAGFRLNNKNVKK